MAFLAGAIIGKAILDASKWIAGGKKVGKSNNLLTGSIKALGKTMIGTGALIGTALTASVVKANEFEKAFSNVRTLIDETQVNTARMKNELLGLDSRLGSAKNLTEGLYQALSAGVEPAKAVQFVGESAKFAKAALVDTNTAVDVITTSLNAYGLNAKKAGKISDILFKTIKFGKSLEHKFIMDNIIVKDINDTRQYGIDFLTDDEIRDIILTDMALGYYDYE